MQCLENPVETLIIPGMKARLLYIVFIAWVAAILTVFFASQPSGIFVHLQGVFSLFSTITYGLIFASAGVGVGYSLLRQLWTEDMGIQRFSIRRVWDGFAGVVGVYISWCWFGEWVVDAFDINHLSMVGLEGICSFGIPGPPYFAMNFHPLPKTPQDGFYGSHHVSYSFPLSLRWAQGRKLLMDTFIIWPIHPGGLEMAVSRPLICLRIGSLPLWRECMYRLLSGLDLTPQLIHLLFALLCVLLTWDWTRLLLGGRAAWSVWCSH